MRSVTTGVLIICYGFINGGSVFLGNPTIVDWVFDGLGVSFILYGIWKIKNKQG